MQNIKLSSAQIWLIHSLELLAVGAIFTASYTVYGAFQAGNFNLPTIGVSLGSAVVALLSKGFSGILSNATTVQALVDAVNDVKVLVSGQAAAPTPAIAPVAVHVYPASSGTPAPVAQVEPVRVPAVEAQPLTTSWHESPAPAPMQAFPQPNVPAASWTVPAQPQASQFVPPPQPFDVSRFNASQIMPTVHPNEQR